MQSPIKLIALIIVALLPNCVNAQLSQYSIGSSGNEIATKVKYLTADKSTVLVGYKYDLSGTTISNCQAIIIKVKSNGSIAWQKTFGVAGKNNLIQDMIITQDGNIVVVGTVGRDNNPFSNNKAAILKFNSQNGQLMWQKCLHDSAATQGGEELFGVAELSDGRLVSVGVHDFTGSGSGSMICVFQGNGTFIYDQVFDIANGDNFSGVVTSQNGTTVYVAGLYVGVTYKDIRIMSYTPGASSGTVNWSKTFDFTINSYTCNYSDKIARFGSNLIVTGSTTNDYGGTLGDIQTLMTLDTNGNNIKIYGIQNSNGAYSNTSTFAGVSGDHVFTVQSPSASAYNPISWISGSASDAVVTEISSMSGNTHNIPVRFKSTDSSFHSFIDMQYADSLLFMAGCTNTSAGFGNNDIYFTISNPSLHSKNNSCDTAHDIVAITTANPVNNIQSVNVFTFLPAYTIVDTGTINFGIKLLCGDTAVIIDVAGLQAQARQVEVYPNPANNVISIKTNDQSGIVKIIDCFGKVLIEKNINSNHYDIDIHSLAPGIYFIKGIFGDEYVYSKFVKN